MIKLRGITKFYSSGFVKTFVLRNIDLDVQEGEFLTIMGPSGAGKSTLLYIIGMLDDASEGQYHFYDQAIHSLNEKKRTQIHQQNIGFVFQSYHLIDELTVYENLETPLLYKKVKSDERKSLVADTLDRFRIVAKKGLFPNQLSGGQQQLVAVARAVIINPKLILADEPTGNLNSGQGEEIMELFKKLNKEGTTIIQVTHSEKNASYSDRVIHLLDGWMESEAKTAMGNGSRDRDPQEKKYGESMKRLLIILLLLFVLLSMFTFGAEEMTLSLQDCLAIALKHNIALGIKVVQVERQEGLLNQAKEKFLPVLAFQLGKAKTNTPSYSWIDAEGAISAASQQLSGQLTQNLWLGGNLTLQVDTSQYESNQRFQTINPRYEGAVVFKLVQPLLRNLGNRISRKSIIIASHNRNISANELKSALLDIVYRVEELYWNLVFAERNLEAKNQSLQLAEDLLKKNRKMAELGVIAEIEILSAEAEAASRRTEILEARALLENSRDELYSTINLGAENRGSAVMIRPGDEPTQRGKNGGHTRGPATGVGQPARLPECRHHP